MNARSRLVSVVAVAAMLVGASAPVFPDVPTTHVYHDEIRELAMMGVVKGDGDTGYFRPGREVNRAEMLVMLYRAFGLIPDPQYTRCYADVSGEEWFGPTVCDATGNEYVQGRADGKFHPADGVQRVEAIKMALTVSGLPVEALNEDQKAVVNYADLSLSAWYIEYLFAAYTLGILPLAGQDSARFGPGDVITRAEAAALIAGTLQAKRDWEAPEEEEEEEEEVEETEEQTIFNVEFPFNDERSFFGKTPMVYRFSIDDDIVTYSEVSLDDDMPGSISCTLYKLESDGISDEYFIGIEQQERCAILATLGPGNYQLQVQPTQPDVSYSVISSYSSGDGNDGFVEAMSISTSTNAMRSLEADDLEDWYTFLVSSDDGRRMVVDLEDDDDTRCTVYSMKDVDLYGFSGPQCNQLYEFPKGTYFISVARKNLGSTVVDYTLTLEPR